MQHTVTAIIPAYNEASRIADVLSVITNATLVNDILVVDDGSTDGTADIAAAQGVRVLKLAENRGKGTALRQGAIAAQGNVLLFLDADLRGLTPSQVDDLVHPVITRQAGMSIGIFQDGRLATDLAQFISPNISGQRCLYRDFFLSTPLVDGCRSGVEIAMTIHARANKVPIRVVPLGKVTHVMKEEKMGFFRGSLARCRMYLDILTTLMRYSLVTRASDHNPVGNE